MEMIWKKTLRACFVSLILFSARGNAAEANELPLPRWSPGDARIFQPDGALLPPHGEHEDATAVAPASGITNFFKLFIPTRSKNEGRASNGAVAKNPPIEKLEPLADESLQACFDMKPDNFLLDPQHLITETQAGDLARLLASHAGEARTAIYILAIGPSQTLPAKADLTQIAGGSLCRRPSCLVVYPIGAPQRARLFSSREIAEVTPPGYLAALAQDCIGDARLASDDMAQIERFAIQLSTRIFWLERSYPFAQPASENENIEKIKAETETLPEIGAPRDAGIAAFWDLAHLRPLAHKVAWPLAGIGLLVFLTQWLVKMRRRRESRMVWLLPEAEVSPRLGGAHSGGCGAMVKYG